MKMLVMFGVLLGLAVAGLARAQEGAGAVTSPLPEGPGLAAKYPGDASIDKDPRVIFFEDFESENWKDKWYQHNVRWRVNEVEAAKGEGMSFGGAASAKLVVGAGKLYGSTLGSGKHPPGWETMHLRWYVKFSENYRGGKLGTTTALDEKTWVPGASGVAPKGTDKANAMVCIQPKGLVEMYYYNLDQRGPWGSGGKPNVGAAPTLPNGRWHCIEVQGTMNVPGEKNSLMKLWVNGELKGEWTGFRWRSAESLKWNSWCFLIGSNKNAPEEQFALIDNVVVATEYIGPLQPAAAKAP